MSFQTRAKAFWDSLTRGGPAGYGAGTAWTGGPLYADSFGAKRGPSTTQLVESFKSIAFACIEFNEAPLAQLPLKLYAASGPGRPKPRRLAEPRDVTPAEFRRLGGLPYVQRAIKFGVDDVSEITNYELNRTLDNACVDPETEFSYFDRPTWIATLARYVDVVGMGWFKPEIKEGGRLEDLVNAGIVPTHLWILQSQYVRPIRTQSTALIQEIGYFDENYRPQDVMMVRLRPGLRDPYGSGYSATQAAWQYLGLEDKSISMWDQLLGTGARPNAVLSPDDPNMPLGDDERDRIDAEMNTWHARGRAGRMAVFTVPMRLQPVNYQGFDLGELHVNNYQLERIANCYGVPVAYLTKETNLANLQAARTQHAVYGITPRAMMIASVLTRLVQRYDDRLFYAFDNAIPEDEERKAKILDMKVKSGLYTGNEANADEPVTPKPWLEQPWMPNTLQTPDMAQERHESGLKAAEAKAKQPAPTNGPPPKAKGGNDDEERSVLRRAEALLTKLEREFES